MKLPFKKSKDVKDVQIASLKAEVMKAENNLSLLFSERLADLELALRGIVFAAVGTCGQRCTSLRRLIVHRSLAEELVA